ncbi:MAG: ATP-binding protein [Thalassobaculales bacterium]
MKHQVVPIKTISRIMEAADALTTRPAGLPGMGLIYGASGLGKTTACAWLRNEIDAVYLCASPLWSPSAMLAALSVELGGRPMHRAAAMADYIGRRLADTGRAVMIDEADYVMQSARLIDTLRYLHDGTAAPIILIGMTGIDQRVRMREQLAGRMSQWVQVTPADRDDVGLLVDSLAEVAVDRDLVDHLHLKAKGSVRRVVVGLSQIEQRARVRGLVRIGLAEWGDGALFLD